MNAVSGVSGLQSAVTRYSSDKVKERSQGHEQVREILGNRDNLTIFQETASRNGGAGWLALFQCLFEVVVNEKKASVKKGLGASGPADRRLADAISLVRWMTERAVLLLSRKPFIAIFRHMVHLLIYGHSIFPPTALDYAKALRTLLSYTPHLENLDQANWKMLMGVCWASALGDEIRGTEEWEEEEPDEAEEPKSKRPLDDGFGTQAGSSRHQHRATISQHNMELISLIPILLSSSAAPLLPAIPSREQPGVPTERVGHSILLKIHRFLVQYPSETSAHLTILRSLNIVLAELELNCRDDFLSAGLKLLPQLTALWTTRSKALREQVVTALRILLPFVTHKTLVESKQAVGVREALERVMDNLPKETIVKWGIEALDLGVLRTRIESAHDARGPFELRSISAGVDFNHEHAMTWAVMELYRDICVYLFTSSDSSVPPTPTREGTSVKRRRVENAFNVLISAVDNGSNKGRLLATQVLIFLIDKHWERLHSEAQADVRRAMLELLDEDDEPVQSWAFIGISLLTQLSHESDRSEEKASAHTLNSPSERLARQRSEEGHWKRAWAHALRKSSSAPICRAACHAAAMLLKYEKLDRSLSIKDIHAFLQNVDVLGPIYPYDSVCQLLATALKMARSDVRLYALGLEDKVLTWLEKCVLLDGPKGKNRMEQAFPADILLLLSAIARTEHNPLAGLTTSEVLPDAAIVDRFLEEARTKPIRDFLLYGTYPSVISSSSPASAQHVAVPRSPSENLAFLDGRPRRLSSYLLNQLSSAISELELPNNAAGAPERIRRCIDLVVLSLALQGSLQLNGYLPDQSCINAAVRLLTAIQPSLLSPALTTPAQHLIWRAFEPLIHQSSVEEELWPILVTPDARSGIRQDLLPPSRYDSACHTDPSMQDDAGGQDPKLSAQAIMGPSQIPASGQSALPPTPITASFEPSFTSLPTPRPVDLVRTIWHLPTVGAAGKELFSLCLKLVGKTTPTSTTNGTQAHLPGHVDDDDFGEIRTAETDAMPLSKEALECQRTSASLLSTAIALRLKGSILSSKAFAQRAYTDPSLLNVLLQAEGERFVEVGSAICEAVHRGWLKLSADAVELILTSLEEMLQSYAYSRHEGLQSLAIDFTRCSLGVWLEVDAANIEVQERMMYLICWLAGRVEKGVVTSWRVRMAMLRLLDDFLRDESAVELWHRAAEEADVEMDSEQDEQQDRGPLAYLSSALCDIDMRVRVRAATSASFVFYRPILSAPLGNSDLRAGLPQPTPSSFYFSALQKLSGDEWHWDTFVSHALWKLNVCVASAAQRPAAVFHMYEIASTTSAYNSHIQSGLEAVARRLGLDGIADLYTPYALVITRSQLREGQMSMRINHKLYGYPSRRAFSASCLANIGSTILAIGEIDFFIAACEAAAIQPESAVNQYFPETAAQTLCDAFAQLDQHGGEDQCIETAMRTLSNLPGLGDRKVLDKKFGEEKDSISADLWELLDLKSSTGEIVEYLGSDSQEGIGFQELMTNDVVGSGSSGGGGEAVEPANSISVIVSTYNYLKRRRTKSSTAVKDNGQTKMVFNALLRLIHRINHVFLLSEQRRYLRALALLLVLFPEEMKNPTILQAYLREMLALLPQPDICGIVLSMVAWGFDKINTASSTLTGLIDLFVALGLACTTLTTCSDSRIQGIGSSLEEWIIKSAPAWTSSDNSRAAFEAALALWHTDLRERLSTSYTPLFVDLRTLGESSNVKNGAELCKQYFQLIQYGQGREEAIKTFVQSLFWHLKNKLRSNHDMFSSEEADVEGIKAFLDILFAANGQVHAPPLTAMSLFSKHQLPIPPVPRERGGRSRAQPMSTRDELQANLRIAVIGEVARFTDADKQETRAMAYRVLRGMLPMLDDSSKAKRDQALLFSPDIQAKLSVLIPTYFPQSSKGPTNTGPAVNGSTAEDLLGQLTEAGWIKYSRSLDRWSRELVKVLCEFVSIQDPFYRSLEPLLSSTVSLRNLLPHLVRAALTPSSPASPSKSASAAKAGTATQPLSEHFTLVLQYPSASTETIQSILDIFLYLRYFLPSSAPTSDALSYNAWLDVDYLVLSSAAVRCGAYASAMLFLELAKDQKRSEPIILSDPKVQNIMYEIYSNVEDPDGFYGIQNHDVRDALLRRLRHEGQSQSAFRWNGAAIEASSNSASQLVLPALHDLHDFGFNRLAAAIAHTRSPNGEGSAEGEGETDPFFYELAWRTGDWDLPLPASPGIEPSSSQAVLYTTLRAVHRERDAEAAMKVVNISLGQEMERLAKLGMEQMAQVKKVTSSLLCLRQVKGWLDPSFQASLDGGQGANAFGAVDKSFDFPTAEKITATRLSLLRAGRERETKNMLGDLGTPRLETINTLEKKCHLRLGEMAREEGRLQAAINAVTAVQQLRPSSGITDGGDVRETEAQDAFSHVLWAQGEHALAIQHLSEMVDELGGKGSKSGARLAVLLGRVAHWTSLAKLKAAHEIKSTFDEAYALSKHHALSNDERGSLCHTYATFADGHYAALSKSSELERLKAYHSRKSTELKQIEATLKSSRRESTASRGSRAAQEVEEDAKAILELENERRTYIKIALKMYASALTLSDAHDDSTTRLCSLWLEHDEDEDVNKDFNASLRKIPSHKFVFLGPQLAARIYKPPQPTYFNSTINGLMLRLSTEHPYHILYQVITLAHGVTPPTSASSASKRKSISAATGAGKEGRGPAAAEILAILSSDASHPLSAKAATHMRVFTEASVQWAHYKEPSSSSAASSSQPTKPKAGSSYALPSDFPFHNLRLDIPIATAPPAIDLTCKYEGIPVFVRFRSGYTIAGGVHRPRIMQCYDSSKRVHGQLFKAEDEVRQDAVMEQVFTMTNDLLTRDRQAKARNLRFRTYNVVPLPERTGIIEFVEGTKGIGEWLKPAHSVYRPKDLSPSELHKRMSDIQDKDPNSPDLVKRYTKSMESFHPVFRHFFAEKHRDPIAWFAMRLNYSRSLAVTSIVGWMVGLGDRHCSNILIDQSTGELVHIDFGIVFEDGRKLRIPEKVPFRLTPDLVDALGLTGVEGTFRQVSSHTLRVLRQSSDLILTVLEVFKHDPLYAWAGDTDKLQRAQGGGKVYVDKSGEEKADRVLGKIRGKLEGGKGGMSVEYTVNMLIQEARNVEHLAKIYHGWAPWF